jgi:hypothetical protein
MARIVFSCPCLVSDKFGEEIGLSPRWLCAFRGEVRFTDEAIEWGKWQVQYGSIHQAVFVRINMSCGYLCRLLVYVDGLTYQFQLPAISPFPLVSFVLDPQWEHGLPFPISYRITRFKVKRVIKDMLTTYALISVAVGSIAILFHCLFE